MTKREMLNTLVAVEDGAEVIVTVEMKEVAQAMLASLDKAADYKKSYESKSKKETLERAELAYAALAELGEPSTCSAIGERLGWSHTRVSALMRKLGDRVVKTYSPKGVALYSVAE